MLDEIIVDRLADSKTGPPDQGFTKILMSLLVLRAPRAVAISARGTICVIMGSRSSFDSNLSALGKTKGARIVERMVNSLANI